MVEQTDKSITIRSILFGLLGIGIVAGLSGFHDDTFSGATLMVGNHLPVAGVSYIVFVALIWNGAMSGLARLLRRSRGLPLSLALSPRELVVVMIVTLVACYTPTSGLFRYFHRSLVLPWYWLNTGGKIEWEKFGVLDYLPSRLFPSPAPVFEDGVMNLDPVVYRGFFTGLIRGTQTVPFRDLPWSAWTGPLLLWGPLIFTFSVCVMALALLVHRQWSRHEQLSYPLAQVSLSFVSRADGRRGLPDLYRNRLFWWGLLPLLVLYACEYLSQWYPEHIPGLRVLLPDFKQWSVPLQNAMPVLRRVQGNWALSSQTVYFSVVGLAFFVSSDISLTMGLNLILLAVVGIWFYMTTGTPLAGGDLEMSRFGAYVGYAVILMYTGRAYFWSVFQRAFLLRGRSEPDDPSVFAARIVLIAFVAMVAIMTRMGTDWLLATVYALIMMLMFLVFTRIICETGIPFLQSNWMPGQVMVSLLGPAAMGPGPMVFLLWIGSILCQDPRESLMPYAATGIRMADDSGLKLRRNFVVLVVALVLALAASFVSSTWTLYNHGPMRDGYAARHVPQMHFDNAAREIGMLHETGMLERSKGLDGFAKLGLISPDIQAVSYMLVGAVLVIGVSMLRFRFTGFPIHPVLFLVWGTYSGQTSWSSFMIGWFIKVLVVRFGGGRVYQQLKPLFVGIIAGELLAAGLSILVNIIYYLATGTTPNIAFGIMAG